MFRSEAAAFLFLFATRVACGQLLFSEVSVEGLLKPKKAVVAEITATLKAETPWGPFLQVEQGKYWRNSRGQIRLDDEHGLSTVVDMTGKRRTRTYVDYERKRADREIIDAPPPKRFHTGLDPWFAQGPRYHKTGEATLEGIKVTIRKAKVGSGERAAEFETWSSDELQLILLFRVTSQGVEFEQRYHNLRLVEPGASMFDLPEDFTVTKLPITPVGRECMKDASESIRLDSPSGLICR